MRITKTLLLSCFLLSLLFPRTLILGQPALAQESTNNGKNNGEGGSGDKDKNDRDKDKDKDEVKKSLPKGFLEELSKSVETRRQDGRTPADEQSARQLDARRQMKEKTTILSTDSSIQIAQKMGAMALKAEEWKELLPQEQRNAVSEGSRMVAFLMAAQAYELAAEDEEQPLKKADMNYSAALFYRYGALQLKKKMQKDKVKNVNEEESLVQYSREALSNLIMAKGHLLFLKDAAKNEDLLTVASLTKSIEGEIAKVNRIVYWDKLGLLKNPNFKTFKIEQPFIDKGNCEDIGDVGHRELCQGIQHGMGDIECPDSSSSNSICHVILNAKTKNCSYLEYLPQDKQAFKQCKEVEHLMSSGSCREGDKFCSNLLAGLTFPLSKSCKELVDGERIAACLGARQGLGLTHEYLTGEELKSEKRVFMQYTCEDPRQRNPDFRVPLYKTIKEIVNVPCQVCRQEECKGCDDLNDPGSFAFNTFYGRQLWQKMYELDFKRGLDRSDIDLMYRGLQMSLHSKKDSKTIEALHRTFLKFYFAYLGRQYQANDLRQMFVLGKTIYDKSDGVAYKTKPVVNGKGTIPHLKSGYDLIEMRMMESYRERNESNMRKFQLQLEKEKQEKLRKQEDEEAKKQAEAFEKANSKTK